MIKSHFLVPVFTVCLMTSEISLVSFMISRKGVPKKFRHLENLILFLKNAIFFEVMFTLKAFLSSCHQGLLCKLHSAM